MKTTLLFTFLLSSTTLFASFGEHWNVEAKAAYYRPTEERFRELYSNGLLYSVQLTNEYCSTFEPWVSVGLYDRSGKSFFEGDTDSVSSPLNTHRTDLTLIPIGVGLQSRFCCDCYTPYIGAGLQFHYLKTKDYSSDVQQHNSDWGVGGMIKLGALKEFNNCWFIDAFAEYSFVKVSRQNFHTPVVKRVSTQTGGLALGGGIGYRF